MSVDLLMFAEDPSAANYLALLLPEFRNRNWSTLLCAANVAAGMLRQRGIDFVETDADTDARELCDEHGPRCVFTGTAENPDTLGLELITAARDRGIPSIAFSDARMNSEYRFRGNSEDPLAHFPDWLLVPDAWTLEAFAGLGVARERIAVCGHPQYDLVRDLAREWSKSGIASFRRRYFPEVSLDRRIVVFVSEGSIRYDLLPNASIKDYGMKGRGHDNGRTKVALEEVLDAIAPMRERPYFVFRVHPIETAGDYAEYAGEIDRFSSEGSALEMIYACDLVIGMTSMLLLEAMLLGKPCLAVLPDASERAWLPGEESGLVPCVTSREDLGVELARLLCGDSLTRARIGIPKVAVGSLSRTADFVAIRLSSSLPLTTFS